MKEIEVYILIDSDGNYECSPDIDIVADRYEDGDTTYIRRMIRVVLNVPLPECLTVPAIDVPAEKMTIEVK